MSKPAWKHCACGFRCRSAAVIAHHRDVKPLLCYSKARAKREKLYRAAEAVEWRRLFASTSVIDDFDVLP